NLEVPWNPALLEQRIARVHRMGQDRPVRVLHLVTRHSIEERVLQVLRQKRALFGGVFAGETDEVNFEAAGRPTFLDGVRELVDGAAEAPASREGGRPGPPGPHPPRPPGPPCRQPRPAARRPPGRI